MKNPFPSPFFASVGYQTWVEGGGEYLFSISQNVRCSRLLADRATPGSKKVEDPSKDFGGRKFEIAQGRRRGLELAWFTTSDDDDEDEDCAEGAEEKKYIILFFPALFSLEGNALKKWISLPGLLFPGKRDLHGDFMDGGGGRGTQIL